MKKLSNLLCVTFCLLLLSLQFSCDPDPVDDDMQNLVVISINEDINEPTTWLNHIDEPGAVDYKITEDIDIKDVLTIEPGVTIAFDAGVLMDVREEGVIIAIGTSSERILFTGCEPTKGIWDGIRFRSNDVRNEMDYCTVAYGGHPDLNANILVDDFAGVESKLKLTNSNIINSLNAGVIVDEDATFNGFSNNMFSDNNGTPLITGMNSVDQIDEASDFSVNNGFNGVEITGSNLTRAVDVTWAKLRNEGQYFLTGDCDVRTGLTINAGCSFLMDPSVLFSIGNDGHIVAEGTLDDRIIFDGLVNDQPSWVGIRFRSDDVRNKLTYCHINAGGSEDIGNTKTNIAVEDHAGVESVVTITNCQITGSGGCGIFVEGDAQLTESSNSFSNNLLDDICQ